MRITKENIFDEIVKGNYLEVLKSDLVDKVKDIYGWTPLHRLAEKKVKEVLSHPSVALVKDLWGKTPLHVLAWNGVKEVLNHPSVDQVKNSSGYTPLHYLARFGYITEKDLRERFPWYKKEIKDIWTAVKEIENTSKSIQFILED